MKNRNPPWADLPRELLSDISKTLALNPIWVLTFRSICKSWRASCPPFSQPSLISPRGLPLSLPSPIYSGYNSDGDGDGPCYLTVTVIYALHRPINSSEEVGLSVMGPSTWILFLKEDDPRYFRAEKPFTRCKYPTPINFPKSFNVIDCNAVELGRFCRISFGFESEDIDKVVLPPNGFSVVALFDGGKLEVFRFDVRYDEEGNFVLSEWEIIHDAKGFRFDDIVVFKGRVLGVDRKGRVYEIDCLSYGMNVIVPPIARGGGKRKRLVESLGSLYMVVRSNVDKNNGGKVGEPNEEMRKTKFRVYKLNEKRKKWVKIRSLGDRSFLFGHDFSFSASADELGISEKNCILFKIGSFQSYRGDHDETNDYKMLTELRKSDLFIGVCDLNDAVHVGSIESYPGYLNMLWPPPPWLWPIDRLKRLDKLENELDYILDRIPENFKTMAAKDSSDDVHKQGTVDAVKEVLRFKETVNALRESETDFLQEYKMLKEALSLHQMDSLLRTARHGTEEGLGSEEAQSGTELVETGNVRCLRELLDSAHKRHCFLFHLEEWVREMVRSPKEELKHILAK